VQQVDMLAETPDAGLLAVNPAYYIPALQDGDVTMVESIAMMEYLLARYGPSPLAPAPMDPTFPTYQQFLHLGEAGIATLLMVPAVSRFLAPEAEQDNWGARQALFWAEKRRTLVQRQLERSTWIAGEAFTAADISITYALEFGRRQGVFTLDEVETAYLDRTMGREAYGRALDASMAGVQT
ncbi:MAG: glutathione S-transferase family protein, partial [Caulobacter sp.]